MYNSKCYLALTFLLTVLYFCVGLINTIDYQDPKSQIKPEMGVSQEKTSEFKLLRLVDIVLSIVAVIDLGFKLMETYIMKKMKDIRNKKFQEII